MSDVVRAAASWLKITTKRASDPDRRPLSDTRLERRLGLRRAAQPVRETFDIVWVGDILLADAAKKHLERFGYTWAFDNLKPLMSGDFLIGIAEGPITDLTERNPLQRWSYNASPESAKALADVGFDAMNLANNHVFDRGPGGVRDTIQHLEAAGIRHFGAGLNDAQAAGPLLIETPHGVVAVLGFGDRRRYYAIASETEPGLTYFDALSIVRGKEIAEASGARWTIACVHWGRNYAPITKKQRQVAATFAAVGYDLVIGAHPHVHQPIDVIDEMPVVYSLGNFVFGTPGRFSPEVPGYGLVARTTIGPTGLERIAVSCIVTDNDIVAFQPRPCPPDVAVQVIGGLGPRVTWDGNSGVVS